MLYSMKQNMEAAQLTSSAFARSNVEDDVIALRDLTDGQFFAHYNIDRFTASILSSRMRYVVKHMSTVLMTTAFSMALRDWYDFAATISGPPGMNYPMSTGSDSIAIFMFTMADGVRNIIEEYGPENLKPGDVIIANDPYRAGLHVNDLCFIRPVFHLDKVVSFVALRAHQLDMGGTVPGGFSGLKQTVYETGLVIPPIQLYRLDRPVPSTFSLIFSNARYAELLLPDIKAVYQSLLLAERLLLESLDRHGLDAYLGAIRYSCDVSAEAMRDAIRTKIPDGIYEGEDIIDADGVDDSLEYKIKVTIRKHHSNLEVDLSGTSVQARSSINCGPLDVKAVVAVALKMLIEHKAHVSSGCFRNFDVVVPAGTICSAIPPDGAIFMYWESAACALTAIYRALAKALGKDAIGGDLGSTMIHNGNGVSRDGIPWLTVGSCGGEHGPWGGTEAGDGDSYTVLHAANNLEPATEAIESEVPVILTRREYVADTAGPGINRGGAAVRRDSLWLEDGFHLASPFRTKLASGIGVNGGRDGTRSACWLFPSDAINCLEHKHLLPTNESMYARSEPIAGMLDPHTKCLSPTGGRYFYYGSKPHWPASRGSSFRFQTAGGGGWGDPLLRDPERVKRDVRDEYVTIDGAYRDYGVKITGDPINDPENLVIDIDATTKHRDEMRRAKHEAR